MAIDADTKLVPSWYLGHRDSESAYAFLGDLEPRLNYTPKKIQVTSDGFPSYKDAMASVFGQRANYAMLVKSYGRTHYKNEEGDRRYRPQECVGIYKDRITSRPKKRDISTSFVERENLTMRMGMRRYTHLTNAFSKKIENMEVAVALHFMHYNFCRPHQSLNKKRALGKTPAMAAGVTNHTWSVKEILGLMYSES